MKRKRTIILGIIFLVALIFSILFFVLTEDLFFIGIPFLIEVIIIFILTIALGLFNKKVFYNLITLISFIILLILLNLFSPFSYMNGTYGGGWVGYPIIFSETGDLPHAQTSFQLIHLIVDLIIYYTLAVLISIIFTKKQKIYKFQVRKDNK